MTEIILILSAFGTAVISGTMGMAGGILLLSIMTSFFPPAVLIPIHGVIQLASNTSRVILSFKSLVKRMVVPFGVGAFAGALLGSQVVFALPEKEYKLILGFFILIMTWIPKIKSAPVFKGKFFALGGVATFLSLFIGATGPLIAPFFIRETLTKEELVSTKAGCQVFVHLFKVSVFFMGGFAFAPYWKLLLGMTLAVFLGNWVGKKILHFFPEKIFLWVFRILISVLAVRLIYQGYLTH